MLEANVVRFIIQDILFTGEYDAKGIAYYTDTHEDVVQEVIDGRHTNPSIYFFWKLIELHREVKRQLYDNIIKKITKEFLMLSSK